MQKFNATNSLATSLGFIASTILSFLFNIINVINGGINIAKLNKSQINNINLSLFTFLTIL
ncbi:hypothetical protein, partial [Mycoplasmopsis bovis]|uniref:hypothetical protein n=1 Tax=Mycoplasmopsis bovis TaxID=28903 RepID=UPI003D2C37B5